MRQKYLHQKSPLFGQEFPSLPGDAVPSAGSSARPEHMVDQETGHMMQEQDPAYGPGPNLRPQTFGTWSQVILISG